MLAVLLGVALAAPDVVLLSVDTLRVDRVGCYDSARGTGFARKTSPNLDAFAAEGLVFEDCVCEVPLTAPSFCSMLTSRYPRMTGTTRNGLRLTPSVPTVAEQFAAAGYQTFCAQSNWTLKARVSGLGRGFDVYDDDFHERRWGIIKSERYAEEVTDAALELLKKRNPSRPMFCWIHYSDPHAPYRFHEAFNPGGQPIPKLAEQDAARARYDSEVAYTDFHIGRLLRELPRENTFVLFVADHGESLYEHDYVGHGRRIYQFEIHIPLIIRGPGIAPGRTPFPARGIDIGPTLLAFAGLSPAPGMLGINVLGNDPRKGRVRVVETYGGAVPKLPGARALMTHRPPMRQGVLADGWKLILRGPQTELFDLRQDPTEQHNLARDCPDRVRSLTALIKEWDAHTPKGRTKEAELGADDLEALESLGYLK